MMSALENLTTAKAKADARTNFERFIAGRRAAGWSDSNVTEYRESIRILMGGDDVAALALFPDGTYQHAEQARQAAREYWAFGIAICCAGSTAIPKKDKRELPASTFAASQ